MNLRRISYLMATQDDCIQTGTTIEEECEDLSNQNTVTDSGKRYVFKVGVDYFILNITSICKPGKFDILVSLAYLKCSNHLNTRPLWYSIFCK